ncbi:MAG: VWA domain-containing protein [Methyloligellaceae bacterium]
MRFGRLFRFFRGLLIVPVLLLFWSENTPAGEQPRVMLVLDASGSMWGQIKGTSKIVIARQAVKDLLSTWDKNIQLGLSAYGHRKKGDCSDIQTIYPVGPTQPDAILQVVNSLKPKGKTPLSEAVRRAAQELKYTENKATVILVSDGVETCKADPCALGAELEQLGVDFTAHVVGFDVAKQEQEGLRCLAENTGGLFLSAKNASELNSALSKAVTAVKKAPVKVVKKAPRPKPAPKPKPAVKPGHRFAAVLSEGDDPVSRGMRWDIYEAKQNPDGKRKHINGNYNAQPKFVLNAGKYLAIAKYGNATVSEEFDVASASEVKHHVLVLNAGRLSLQATLAEGADVIKRGMRWDVYLPGKDIDGKRKHVNGNYDRTPIFNLPAGKYLVVAKTGNATVSGEVEVKPGELTERTFVMNAGIAAFSASYTEGGTPITKGMRWDVYGLEKDIDGKRRHINGNYDAKPKFRLPAGKYHVVAKRGNATVSGEIEITAGKRTDTAFVMSAGLLALSATLTSGKGPMKKGMRWDVYSLEKDLEGKRKHINGNYDAKPVFALPEGKYHVVAKAGNAIKAGEVEVNAGKRTESLFDLNAGMVKLVAMTKDGGQVKKGMRWDIYSAEKDIEGKRRHFAGNYNSAPIFTLNAGEYLIVLKRGQAKKQQPLTIKPGDSRQVDVALE